MSAGVLSGPCAEPVKHDAGESGRHSGRRNIFLGHIHRQDRDRSPAIPVAGTSFFSFVGLGSVNTQHVYPFTALCLQEDITRAVTDAIAAERAEKAKEDDMIKEQESALVARCVFACCQFSSPLPAPGNAFAVLHSLLTH